MQSADPGQIQVKLALRKALSGCQAVLDVGCGSALTLRQLEVPHCVGIEGYRPEFEKARSLNTQDELVFGDVRELTSHFKPGQFDACIAMDVIEHLTKADGLKLMRDMELIAKKKVVIFTPNGFLPQRQSAGSDLQAHFSGWEVDEMRHHGYDVMGMLGPKKLRVNIMCSNATRPFFGDWFPSGSNYFGFATVRKMRRPFFAQRHSQFPALTLLPKPSLVMFFQFSDSFDHRLKEPPSQKSFKAVPPRGNTPSPCQEYQHLEKRSNWSHQMIRRYSSKYSNPVMIPVDRSVPAKAASCLHERF